jgi:hypothetical protein
MPDGSVLLVEILGHVQLYRLAAAGEFIEPSP